MNKKEINKLIKLLEQNSPQLEKLATCNKMTI